MKGLWILCALALLALPLWGCNKEDMPGEDITGEQESAASSGEDSSSEEASWEWVSQWEQEDESGEELFSAPEEESSISEATSREEESSSPEAHYPPAESSAAESSISAPSSGGESGPEEVFLPPVDQALSVEDGILALINSERDALGLKALKGDTRLARAAGIRSRELYDNNYFSHLRPNGDNWSTVLQEIPVSALAHGENLASVTYSAGSADSAADPAYWYNIWAGSPTHYQNMTRGDYTHVGIAVYRGESNGTVRAYATTIFAKSPS